ncbi:transposase [Salmonella enterica subsp. enterica serovar Thompson]|nr:transposase [Salmonella enterica]
MALLQRQLAPAQRPVPLRHPGYAEAGAPAGYRGRYLLCPAYLRPAAESAHVSVTRGGIDVKHGVWRSLFFKKKAVEEIWRGAVTRLLRGSYERVRPGTLPGLGHIRDERQWRRYLKAQYGRHWKVHFAKKTRGAWHSVKYLGRYLKRPPVERWYTTTSITARESINARR